MLAAMAASSPGGDGFELPPVGRIVAQVDVDDGRAVELYLDLPAAFVREELDAAWLDTMSHHWTHELQADTTGDRDRGRPWGVTAFAIDPEDSESGWKPITALLPPIEPVHPRGYETALGASPGPPLVSLGADMPGSSAGLLSGKVVYISQAHGFYWSETLGRWAAQRGNTNGIVEDLVNAEAMNHYLMNYLRNAGATVFTMREEDMQTEMVIVDAEVGGGSSAEGAGEYSETGAWLDSSLAGFQAGDAPYPSGFNPHASGSTRYANATTSPQADAAATWTPSIPKDGFYAVYVSYAASPNRVPDAHYVVAHAGGDTHLRVNQQRHGNTWVRLGRFWFVAGDDEGQGSVTLLNDTLAGTDQQVVSGDAVRFGGGMGDIARLGTGAGAADAPTSLMARWREASRYYSQFMGAPTSVYDASGADHHDDVGNRSRTAAWHNEAGEHAVFVSWHTNAPNPARGTSTYVYGPNPPDGSLNPTGVAGSLALANLLQDEIVGDVRAAFDPGWADRGVNSAYFGELNPSNNPEMPAALIEAAFHDTPADADYLEEPRFRQTLARAVYQAVAKYFAQADGVAAVLLPEAPNRLRVTNGPGSGEVTVRWDAPWTDTVGLVGDAASGYRVHMSLDGRAFDNGTEVSGGATTLVVSGLQVGAPVFFKVVATNAGGASMPTPTIPAVVTCDGAQAPALGVMGFYRMDSALLPRDDLTPWSLGEVKALRYFQVNTYDYLVEHAWAFATAGLAMDGAEATAVEDGALPLDPYQAVVWQLGEESTADETFSEDEQAVVSDWLAMGDKTLIASGAEILWDLVHKGTAADAQFATTTFGAGYGADDADSYAVGGAGALADVPPLTISDGSDGLYGTYDAEFLDVLLPQDGAQGVLTYDGLAAVAAAWFEGATHDALLMGFPFEAVRPATARAALAHAIVELAGLAVIGSCIPSAADQGPEPQPESAPEAAPRGPSDSAPGPDTMARDSTVAPPSETTGSVRPGNSTASVSGGEGCSGSRPADGLVPIALSLVAALLLLIGRLRSIRSPAPPARTSATTSSERPQPA